MLLANKQPTIYMNYTAFTVYFSIDRDSLKGFKKDLGVAT